jgi:hypothetical protein
MKAKVRWREQKKKNQRTRFNNSLKKSLDTLSTCN